MIGEIKEKFSRMATEEEVQKVLARQVQILKKEFDSKGPIEEEKEWQEFLQSQRVKVETDDEEVMEDDIVPGINLIVNDDDEINYYIFLKKNLLSVIKIEIKDFKNQNYIFYLINSFESNIRNTKEGAFNTHLLMERKDGVLIEKEPGNYFKIFK